VEGSLGNRAVRSSAPRKLREDVTRTRTTSEEAGLDQRLEKTKARLPIDTPHPHGLFQREVEARHLEILAADLPQKAFAIDESCVARDGYGHDASSDLQ
jgi:hypothetical protein